MGDKAIAIASDIKCCVPATPAQFVKTVAAAGTPEALTASRTYFRQAIFKAVKALAGTANTGDVKLGFASPVNEQPIVLTPGDTYVLQPTPGEKWDFATLYLDAATNGDGVVVIYS